MATYAELYDLQANDPLRNKVAVACVVAAETIRTEAPATDNHANRLTWAKAVFASPPNEARRMLWAVLAANKDQTVSAIEGASDVTVQSNVDAAVDVFATGS